MSSRRRRYQKSIKTLRFKKLRAKVLERDNHTCQVCHAGGRPGNELEVHHKTYDRLGREDMDDLVTVHSSCHGRLHDELRAFNIQPTTNCRSVMDPDEARKFLDALRSGQEGEGEAARRTADWFDRLGKEDG